MNFKTLSALSSPGTLSLILLAAMPVSVQAAVVMNGSRIVMEGKMEKTIQFENTSEGPFLVQVASKDSLQGTPELVAVPPVFQIKGGAGQVVRLKLLNSNLPQDKESLFHFSFTQIPGAPKQAAAQSHLNIVVESSMKLIYRPKGVPPLSTETASQLTFSHQGRRVILNNHSKNVISLSKLTAGKAVLAKSMTILPGEKAEVGNSSDRSIATLNASILNDYGMGIDILIKKQ